MAPKTPASRGTPVKRRRGTAPVQRLAGPEPVRPATVSAHYQAAIEMIGQRWTGAIIRSLLAGRSRFSDIRASIPDLSDRLLWERLKTLEEHGVVERTVVNRRHTEYILTPMGRALEPVVAAAAAWAQEWVVPRRSRRARPRAARRTA